MKSEIWKMELPGEFEKDIAVESLGQFVDIDWASSSFNSCLFCAVAQAVCFAAVGLVGRNVNSK